MQQLVVDMQGLAKDVLGLEPEVDALERVVRHMMVTKADSPSISQTAA